MIFFRGIYGALEIIKYGDEFGYKADVGEFDKLLFFLRQAFFDILGLRLQPQQFIEVLLGKVRLFLVIFLLLIIIFHRHTVSNALVIWPATQSTTGTTRL